MSSGNVRNEVQEKDEIKREKKKGNARNIDIDFSNDTMGSPKQIPLFLKIYWRVCWRFITKYIAVNHRCVNN